MRIAIPLKSRTLTTLKISLGLLAGATLFPLTVMPADVSGHAPRVEMKEASPRVQTVALTEIAARQQALQTRKLAGYIEDRFKVSEATAAMIVTEAIHTGQRKGLEPELILAIIAVESTFRARAVSPVGARGLMQVMARYHPHKVMEIGGADALFDPQKNIHTGSKILVDYLDLSGGDLRQALLRYNGSLGIPGARYPDRVLQVYNDLKKVTRQDLVV